MDPLTIAAIASAVIGAGKMAYGAYQSSRGSQMAQEKRPEYDIPEEVDDLDRLSSMYRDYLTRIEATETIPGQERAERQIRGATQRGIRATTERARTSVDALGAATELYGREIEQMQQLELESIREKARQKVRAMRDYVRTGRGVAQTQAQYSDQAFRLNEMEPWLQRQIEAQERRRAGYNMMGAGMSDMGTAARMYGYSDGFGQNNTQNFNSNEQWMQRNQGSVYDYNNSYDYGGNPFT
jgi:hypothetical protein